MVSVISGPCESPGEELDAGDHDPGFCTGDGCFEVFCKTPVTTDPGEGALNHPTFGLRLEGSDGLGSGDDFDRPLAQAGESIKQLWSSIDPIGEDVAQLGEPSPDRPQQRHCAVIVLNISG